MSEVNQIVEQAKPVKQANPNIINGRMPVAIVHQIRFGNDKNDSTKSLAAKYGTTVGKIDDIKKGRNFAYVTEDFRPTDLQREEGLNWLQRHPKYNTGEVDTVINELSNVELATPEQAAAFESIRKKAGGQKSVAEDGTIINAGGGNRRKSKKDAKVQSEPAQEITADDLLA